MTAILRNNATGARQTVGGAKMGRGGSGKAPLVAGHGIGKVKQQLRKPADPAAELMPAAEFLGYETDFGAILERFPDSPFDPARRKVLGRLMGMFAMDYQGARSEERHFLRRLLAARNAREAYAANRALHLCGAPHAVRRTLALGVAESRFATGPTRGFLGAVQARSAATTFRLLGPRGRERIWNVLTRAGCDDDGRPLAEADRILERALILKALAARRHRLGPWSTTGDAALGEVSGFGEAIRGLTRRDLAARTTLVAGDKERQAAILGERVNPAALAGLVSRGEVDPLFAWARHGARGERVPGKVGEVTRDDAFPDLDRSPLVDRPRFHQTVAEARAADDDRLTAVQRTALTDFLAGRTLRAERQGHKREALAVIAERCFDVAGEVTIDAIRQDAQGIYRFDPARALGDLLSRYTGATYVRRLFSDQITAGSDPLGQIRRALESGMSVPIAVTEIKAAMMHAAAAVERFGEPGDSYWEMLLQVSYGETAMVTLPAKKLLQPVLPDDFGRKARAYAYMAPAALDLLAPPFGLPFPQLGIKDLL